MSDWIEWKGGECPVADGVQVDLRFRKGEEYHNFNGGLSWRHHGSEADIVAYRVCAPLETGAPSRDWVEFRQQADRGEHPLPPAAPAATPRTDSIGRLLMLIVQSDNKQSRCANADLLSAQIADLRGKMEFLCLFNKREAEKQHERAEAAEAKLATARADERERCAKVLEARAESVEGPTNAYAVGELYEAALAIRALKEASNG